MSEVSVQDWEFSKNNLKTAIMGRFPFHLNWWSTWGLHQALQIPQYPSPLACCQLSRAGRAAHGHSHHQWVACPSIPAVKGKVEQQKRLPKPLVKSNAAILPAWESGKCVFKHCACVRMLPWCKVFVSKQNPAILGHPCCDEQPESQRKAAEENEDAWWPFRERGIPFTFSCLFTGQNLRFHSLLSPPYLDALLAKHKFQTWAESLSFLSKTFAPTNSTYYFRNNSKVLKLSEF